MFRNKVVQKIYGLSEQLLLNHLPDLSYCDCNLRFTCVAEDKKDEDRNWQQGKRNSDDYAQR